MSETIQSVEGADDARAPYEPPAIEQSAGFERLMLGCMFTELDDPPCPAAQQFSAPM